MAGTSTATVSRVLSNRGAVSAPLRERVLAVIHKTGFVPNLHASAMARKRFVRGGLVHRTIAMALLGAKDETFSRLWEETYEGILEAANELDLAVTLCRVGAEELAQGHRPASLTRIPCDGILSTHPPGMDPSLLKTVAPTVLIGGGPTRLLGLPSVDPDDYLGVSGLLDHLSSVGHRRYEFVAVSFGHQAYAARASAFCTEVARRGVEGRVAEAIGERYEDYAAAFARRDPATRPTALLVSSDGPAVSLLHALLAVGVRVPEQVSIVGFDGRPWGRDSVPPLTSWHVDWREVGRMGVRVLVDVIAGKPAPSRVLVGGSVLARASVGPPPGWNAPAAAEKRR